MSINSIGYKFNDSFISSEIAILSKSRQLLSGILTQQSTAPFHGARDMLASSPGLGHFFGFSCRGRGGGGGGFGFGRLGGLTSFLNRLGFLSGISSLFCSKCFRLSFFVQFIVNRNINERTDTTDLLHNLTFFAQCLTISD